MILDERTEFADALSVAAAAGTVLLGDIVDTTIGQFTTSDIGLGEDVWIVIQTDTEIITGGSAGTIQFFVVSDALVTLGGAVVASCTLHLSTKAYVTGNSASNDPELNVGGVILAAHLPAGTYERYLGILVTTATTTTTAGKVNAFLTRDYAKWIATADAVN
jgi:hypothetical protein